MVPIRKCDPFGSVIMVTGTRGTAVVPPGVVAGETFVVECELPNRGPLYPYPYPCPYPYPYP
jgi:hypothetical protein